MVVDETLIARAMPYSKTGEHRLRATWMACQDADSRRLPGVFVECGVWRGGNLMVARWASPSRLCWIYDTFAGMTAPSRIDGEKANYLFGVHGEGKGIKKTAASVTEVRDNLIAEGVFDGAKIMWVEGDVRVTLRDPKNLPSRIAVLRLDTDFYDSTKIELEVLYPLLVSGGYLIVDDYGHWPGCRAAVNEFLGPKVRHLRSIDYSGMWMVKP